LNAELAIEFGPVLRTWTREERYTDGLMLALMPSASSFHELAKVPKGLCSRGDAVEGPRKQAVIRLKTIINANQITTIVVV
jgi:hypothetical protein